MGEVSSSQGISHSIAKLEILIHLNAFLWTARLDNRTWRKHTQHRENIKTTEIQWKCDSKLTSVTLIMLLQESKTKYKTLYIFTVSFIVVVSDSAYWNTASVIRRSLVLVQ